MQRYKSHFILLAKAVFALGILWWLSKSGHLDLQTIKERAQNPWPMLCGFFILALQLASNSVRWMIIIRPYLLRPVNFSSSYFMNWISAFLCSFLPGSVTGDFIKYGHLKKIDDTLTKKKFFVLVFLDRVSGLLAIIILAGTLSLFAKNLQKIPQHIAFSQNILVLGAVLIILGLLTLPYFNKVFCRLTKIEFVLNPKSIITSVILSLFSQALILVTFFLLANDFLPENFPILTAAPFIMLAFVVNAIPIAPSGIGVGHAAFAAVFSLFDVNNGANFFNFYLLVQLSFNLFGVIPFLFYKQDTKNHSLE